MAHSIDVSIVIPIYNEGRNVRTLLSNLTHFVGEDVEVIFVDGGSTDDSVDSIEDYLSTARLNGVVIHSARGRAKQQNLGAKNARGRFLLFLHADTYLPANAIESIVSAVDSRYFWGRFDVRLNSERQAFRVIEWFINKRSRLTGIATGDQAIFCSKEIFTLSNGFPDQALMEDIEISKRLKQLSKPHFISDRVVTSARKWLNHGIIKTVLLMWKIRAAYYFGANADKLHQQYYKSD